MINLPILCGTSIDGAIDKALALVKHKKQQVSFNFNGVDVIAGLHDSYNSVYIQWDSKMKQAAEVYRKTPEYEAQQIKRNKQIQHKQKIVNDCVNSLENTLNSGSLDMIMTWIKLFSECADDIGVGCDYKKLYDVFKDYGYKINENIGLTEDKYEQKEIMGRYIIGQVMSFLKENNPPHPVASSFVDKYFALK
jgi:hypothetical protein